jgi:hypothetical protein
MAFYKKLFADTDDNNRENRPKIFDDQGDITRESQSELLILLIYCIAILSLLKLIQVTTPL